MNELKLGVAGYYRLTATRPDGSERTLADWFPNLITDNGLDLMGQGDYTGWCRVGSGNTTPAFTDTSLATPVASASQSSTDYEVGGVDVAPRYGYRRSKYVFAKGAAAGNLAEVAVAPGQTGLLFSRALILDQAGNPTVVTVLSDEILTVTYELRVYLPSADVNGSIVINGSTYATKMRAAKFGTGASMWGGSITGQRAGCSNAAEANFGMTTDGDLGTIYQSPSGNNTGFQFNGTSVTNADYTNGTHYRDCTVTLPENYHNYSTGIKSIQFDTTLGGYQMSFTPTIMKDNTKIFTYVMRLSWGRYAG